LAQAEALAQEEALAKEEGADGPYPWEGGDGSAEDPDAPRQRHDAFTEARKSVWLRALVKTGCILDACRLTGISPRTIYRHQERDPSFFENCRVALRISGTPVELTAWSRAVEGVEQEFACGGQVHVRRRYSDGLLRLLLQGSNPKKYGLRAGFRRGGRKTDDRIGRTKGPPERTYEEAVQSILGKIEAIERHEEPKKRAAGWTKSAEGHWIPPGYAWTGLAGGSGGPGEEGAQGGTPRDSM